MPRDAKIRTTQLAFRCPDELTTLLDQETARVALQRKGSKLTLSDTIRELLYEELDRREKKYGKKTP